MTDRYVITGGAGFIGTNLAERHLARGGRVIVIDNFSRAGSTANAEWLARRHGSLLRIVEADVRRRDPAIAAAIEEADVVFHLAAQVAVTTSVTRPVDDFEVNALGTFNILESVRTAGSRPIVIYSSTNKVYGKLEDLEVAERGQRCELTGLPDGVPETRPLDFYSPYGCSKGTGDQYAIDYARIYGLQTVVFRQSCIYGPHQFGIEDQGWLAWFAIQALQRLPVTIYGTGRQVRDVLYVGDLLDAYDAAIANISRTSGHAYNVGGGPRHTLSLLELIAMLERMLGHRVDYRFADWRPGDQCVYVSDVSKAFRHFGWRPTVVPAEGLERLMAWLRSEVPARIAV